MKFTKAIILTSLLLLVAPTTLQAAITVVDLGLIKTNLFNAKRDLAQQILQEANQKTQILKLANQIRQLDDYLHRFGRPEDVDIRVLTEMFKFLRGLELNKTSQEIIRGFDTNEVFRGEANAPYRKLEQGIVVDGKVVARRDGKIYAPEVAARRSFEHYRDVRTATLKKRTTIKRQIEHAMQQLQRAKTSSEVQKLAIVMTSLQTQLASTDSEIQFAASEALTRFLQNQVEKEVTRKAHVQSEQAALRTSTEKDLDFYRLPNKPFLFPRS